MGRIIAIANQKGGVGKTTTAINLSEAVAEQGKKVLVVDCDPQGNTTSGLGVDKNSTENTVYELLLDDCSVQECIIEGVYPNLDLIASNVDLAGAEVELVTSERSGSSSLFLKDALKQVKDHYDFIFIDCPPSLNILTVNAMSAADTILVPIQCEYYALEGLSQLVTTVDLIKKRLNPELVIEGLVFTMYDARTNLSMQVVENVKQHANQYVYGTIIPRNIKLAEAPSYGEPITIYDRKSAGAMAYLSLAAEIIARKF